jgi:hypothetical protein
MTNTIDKDYNDNYEHKWTDKDDYYYEDNKSDILIITFAGFGSKDSKPTFIFNNFLREYKIDKLFIRDLKCRYYLLGLGKHSNDIITTVEFIKSIYSHKKYNKIIVIGCSSGGYASILYGNLLQVNKIIAFSPQTIINENKKILGDNRFENTCNDIIKKIDKDYKKYLDLNNIDTNIDTEIHYAKYNKEDKIQAENLKNNKIKLYSYNTNNHLLAIELRNNGELKKIIEDNIFN